MSSDLAPGVDLADVDLAASGSGVVVLAVPLALVRLVEGWLAEYGSVETARAYRRGWAAGWPGASRPAWIRCWLAATMSPGTPARCCRPSGCSSPPPPKKTRVIKPRGATVNRALAALSSFYTYAHEAEAVPRNPVSIRRPKVPRTGRTPGLALDDARRLLRQACRWRHGPPGRAAVLVHLMTATAIRVGEALGADVDDLGHHDGHAVLWVVRKGDTDPIPVAIPPAVVRTLTDYLLPRPDVCPPAHPGPGRPRRCCRPRPGGAGANPQRTG